MKGRKTGGRKKGTTNKTTKEAREAFRLVYEGRLDDLDRWIRETGDGFEAVHFLADGTAIPFKERSPGKAADLLLRMAEHFVPKLGRVEHELSGPGGGPIQFRDGLTDPERLARLASLHDAIRARDPGRAARGAEAVEPAVGTADEGPGE